MIKGYSYRPHQSAPTHAQNPRLLKNPCTINWCNLWMPCLVVVVGWCFLQTISLKSTCGEAGRDGIELIETGTPESGMKVSEISDAADKPQTN